MHQNRTSLNRQKSRRVPTSEQAVKAARELASPKASAWIPLDTLRRVPYERQIVCGRYLSRSRQTLIVEAVSLSESDVAQTGRLPNLGSPALAEVSRALVVLGLGLGLRTIAQQLRPSAHGGSLQAVLVHSLRMLMRGIWSLLSLPFQLAKGLARFLLISARLRQPADK